jgi:hypothetical protein
MSVSNNWVQLGELTQLSNGEPLPVGILNTGISALAPIALTYRLFDVGVIQGRLVSVLFTICSLILLYKLTSKLHNPTIGAIAIFTTLFLSIGWTNPIFVGRQILGENAALYYLITGYWLFLSALKSRYLNAVLVAVFWVLAVISKSQVLPPIVISMILLLIYFTAVHEHKRVVIIGLIFIVFSLTLLVFNNWMPIFNGNMDAETRRELFFTTVFVPVLSVRVITLLNTFVFCFPLIVGMIDSIKGLVKDIKEAPILSNNDVIILSLLLFISAWVFWFGFLSNGWSRYLYIPVFFGSIFISPMIYNYSQKLNIRATLKNGNDVVRHLDFRASKLSALLIVVIVAFYLPVNVFQNLKAITSPADKSMWAVVDFINEYAPSDALVETYEMELFPYLERIYHYPPDRVQLLLNRNLFQYQNEQIEYNPLEMDPDYLILGQKSKEWKLYDDVVKTGEFRLIKTFNNYDIYQRQRNQNFVLQNDAG